MLVDDYVFDFTDWIKNGGHPGGADLLKKSVSKDIGRYLNGSATEMVHKAMGQIRNHSPSAYSDLRRFLIGKLNNQQYSYIPNQNQATNTEDDYLIKNEFIDFKNLEKYKLINKKQITKNIIMLSFQPTQGTFINDINQLKENWLWDCGKHFKVVFTSQYVSEKVGSSNARFNSSNTYQYRYYSMQRVLNPMNSQLVNAQDKDAQGRKTNVQSKGDGIEAQNKRYDCLDLYIKVYHQNGFLSMLMDKIQLQEEVMMSQPVGTGLMLTPLFFKNNKNPNIAVFCGGTAINAFMDLVLYTFYQKMNSSVKYKVKVSLFAGFQNEDECYALPVLQAIQSYNPDDFKYTLYFSRQSTDLEKKYKRRFDNSFIKENLNSALITRVYIRGPLPFENAVKKTVKEIGFASSQIIML